jgi:predicted dehydrogenase
MSGTDNSRRNFIKRSTAGAVSSAIAWNAASYSRVLGANDRIGIGIVGFSERALEALLPSFLRVASEQNCEIVALSDIWKLRREEGAAWISKQSGKTPVLARNNDELYQMKEVQGVIISTADHQHALHGVEAVKAERDAYIEKPLANQMADAQAVLKAVKETKRIVQIGTQRRSSKSHQLARDFIQSGEFGQINMVEMTTNANQPLRWRRQKLVEALRHEDTDWKRFVMGRTRESFNPRKYIEFRLYWPYSSGIPCQWMVHQIDALHFLTGLPHPRSVIAQGGIYQWQDGRINPDTVTAVFDYGPLNDSSKGFQVIYSSRMGNSAHGNSDTYFSKDGTFELGGGKITREGGLSEPKAGWRATTLAERTLGDGATRRENSVDAHMRNWLECVRSRKSPVADIEAGYNHSVALCMTIAALHSGKRATFDDIKQQVV